MFQQDLEVKMLVVNNSSISVCEYIEIKVLKERIQQKGQNLVKEEINLYNEDYCMGDV